MAVTRDNIILGAHTSLSIGAYVAAKGAGTLVEVGATLGGVTLDPKTTLHMVSIDQRLGDVMAVPIKREYDLKFRLGEGITDNYLIALAQPVANRTGTAPNYTVNVDPSAGELYYQLQLVGKGQLVSGAPKTRTITFWRGFVKDTGPIPFKKDDVQGFDMTFGILDETTGTGSDNGFRSVDS